MKKSMSLTMDKVFADRNNNDRFIDKGNHAFTLTIKGYTEEESEKIIDTFESRINIIIDDCNDFSMARCPNIDVDENNNCEYSDTLVIIDEEIDTLKKEWKKFKKSENIKSILKLMEIREAQEIAKQATETIETSEETIETSEEKQTFENSDNWEKNENQIGQYWSIVGKNKQTNEIVTMTLIGSKYKIVKELRQNRISVSYDNVKRLEVAEKLKEMNVDTIDKKYINTMEDIEKWEQDKYKFIQEKMNKK